MVETMERTWSERKRDKFEREAAAKRELIVERRYGLDIIVHWLRSTNQISMTLIEDNVAREFLVPNDSVLDARDHPEHFANQAGLPRRRDNAPTTDVGL